MNLNLTNLLGYLFGGLFVLFEACSSPPSPVPVFEGYTKQDLEQLLQGEDHTYRGNLSPYIPVGYRDFDLVNLKGLFPVDTNTMKGYLEEGGLFASRFWLVKDINPNQKSIIEYRSTSGEIHSHPICLKKENGVWGGHPSLTYSVRGNPEYITYLIKEGNVVYTFYIGFDKNNRDISEIWRSTDTSIVAVKGLWEVPKGNFLNQFQYCESLLSNNQPYLDLKFIKVNNKYTMGVEGLMNGHEIRLDSDKPCLNILQGMHVGELPFQNKFRVCGSENKYYLHVEDIDVM